MRCDGEHRWVSESSSQRRIMILYWPVLHLMQQRTRTNQAYCNWESAARIEVLSFFTGTRDPLPSERASTFSSLPHGPTETQENPLPFPISRKLEKASLAIIVLLDSAFIVRLSHTPVKLVSPPPVFVPGLSVVDFNVNKWLSKTMCMFLHS